MIKRVLNLLGGLVGIFLIILAAPSMLIVPSGQDLTPANYISALASVLVGGAILCAVWYSNKRK